MANGAEESESEVRTVNTDEPAPVEARPALPPPSVPPAAPPRTATGPSFGERVGRFFRFIFQLFLLLFLLGVLSLVLYLALPWFHQTFVRPVEQNTAQIRQLQTWKEEAEGDLADLQTKLGTIESVQNGHDESLKKMDVRLQDIETEINARTESLAALERLQSELEEQNQLISAELERQIDLLKAMELMSRARLSMYQSNFGLAKQDVQIARDLLAGIETEDASASLAKDLGAVVLRLDMTLTNLPDFPVAASDDLDIAWQILLSGLPQATPTGIETPTLVATVSITPTGRVTSTPTPVPSGSSSASSTPTAVVTATSSPIP